MCCLSKLRATSSDLWAALCICKAKDISDLHLLNQSTNQQANDKISGAMQFISDGCEASRSSSSTESMIIIITIISSTANCIKCQNSYVSLMHFTSVNDNKTHLIWHLFASIEVKYLVQISLTVSACAPADLSIFWSIRVITDLITSVRTHPPT